ncbi:Auxin response factor 13 [Zea mays]|uniref:ARF transcription factor n=1 Tax=Zea mays TaxID=4577 RepID=C0P7I4_MAIZE|eukprot:NP_001168636.1 hypothetical protein [Zea mays]
MATQQPLPPADGVGDNTVDRDVWLACAAPFSRIPTVGDEVYYFPDGHIEQHQHLSAAPLPAQDRFHCTVTDVSLGVDDKTDEVFAKISLRPRPGRAAAPPPGPGGSSNSPAPAPGPPQKLRYFTKDLSQTDVYAKFRIPLENEHVLPIPKVETDGADQQRVQRQDVVMRDTRGKSWRFSETYRVNPSKEHSLGTGWLDFAKAKRLAAGDKIVFMRRPNGDLIVGVRRLHVPRYRPFDFQGPAQDVMEAVRLAAAGRPFTVTYFPRQAAVEFIVPRSEVDDALATSWEPGAVVRMEVMEDENRQHTVWVHGRVNAIRQNIWRMLEIIWGVDPPLATTRSVNAWQVASLPPLATTGRSVIRSESESQAQSPSSSTRASRHTDSGPSATPFSATPPRTISIPSASPPNNPVSLSPLQNVKTIKLFGETISVDGGGGGGSEQVNRAPPSS